MADTFGDTPESMEACFSTSTPPTIDGLPSISCGQGTAMSSCQFKGQQQHDSIRQVTRRPTLAFCCLTSSQVQLLSGVTLLCVTTPVRFQNQWEANTSCTSSIRRPLVSGRKKATNSCRQQWCQVEMVWLV